MNRYMIDYTRPDGSEDFIGVDAETAEDAARIFHSAGIDGWHGYDYADYAITAVTFRCAWND